jgi:hypothetical protein
MTTYQRVVATGTGRRCRKLQQIPAIFKYDGRCRGQDRDPFYVSRSVWVRSLISSFGLEATRRRGQFSFSHNEACVRVLYSVPPANVPTAPLATLSHTSRDISDSRHPFTDGMANTHAHTMNSLYTLGVRQSSSIQADLERMRGGDTSASLLGLSPPLTRSDLVSDILYPARADICFARRNEPHHR